ncbi:hypothetical protein IGI04_032652, partial [Brassica rapa subsp. trilocularis]
NRKDTAKIRKTLGGTSDQTQPCSDSTKVSPYRDVDKEGVVVKEEDQLALDVKGLNLDDQPTWKKAQTFTFEELKVATGNFRSDCFLGEGGFGKVFKGTLEKLDQVVAIKQLDRNDLPYGKKPLDWSTRMKIAAGAARGLEYLHDRMKPPVIYRDLKCSNILLGEDYQPKLSDFGLAKVGPSGDNTHVSTRVMGTYGYCAPDYAMTGQLTFKSDIYSFGVVLLELITGRKAIDSTKERKDQNLVGWARPLFKDRRNFPKMVDPLLQGQYPVRGLYQALAIAAMCVQEQPNMRPVVSDVVLALNFLASSKYDPNSPSSSSRRRNASLHRDRDDEEKRPDLLKETESEILKSIPSTMVNQTSVTIAQAPSPLFFTQVSAEPGDSKLQFRLIHFWEARKHAKGGILIGIEMLMINEQRQQYELSHHTFTYSAELIFFYLISRALSPSGSLLKTVLQLKRGSIYTLTNFFASNSKVMYGVADQKLAFRLSASGSIPFQILKPTAILKGIFMMLLVTLSWLDGQALHQRPVLRTKDGSTSQKIMVHLQIKDGPVMNVYLWDQAAYYPYEHRTYYP